MFGIIYYSCTFELSEYQNTCLAKILELSILDLFIYIYIFFVAIRIEGPLGSPMRMSTYEQIE